MSFNTLALVAVGGLFSPARADGLDEIRRAGEIRVGVVTDIAPFGYIDPKTQLVAGYDIDFAKFVAQQLGVKVAFTVLQRDDRLPALKEKRVDLVVAALINAPERAKEVDMSYSYFVSVPKIAAKAGRFSELSQLQAARICAPKGSFLLSVIKEALPAATPVISDTNVQAFQNLMKGDCDAVAGSAAALRHQLQRMPADSGLEVPDIPLSMKRLSMAVHKDETRLLDAVNAALLQAEKSGKAIRMFERHFGKQSVAPQMRAFKIYADTVKAE
ncbi:polar amino acid transport system substrate-binding protein [Chitinivorax tropicus]|uniref:Polar amino acid transport system substrate-binding protein n=1 Tax=Chitinivorax tropicus TaxID=714531 RepID=A0A840MN26_9PROT|nr:transporter substrate-binding domain-containing protein [Chitinivorax tropicus]MBB5018367.1 polar amino acid transport system substrate-binding protein [Chitinivorax tropicus]